MAKRSLPRLAVGKAVRCLILTGVMVSIWGTGSLPVGGAIIWTLWLLASTVRFDVYALQWGRPVSYVMDEDRLTVWRGSTAVMTFRFADVTEWSAPAPASLFYYWIGQGFGREFFFVSTLGKFSFKVLQPDGSRKEVDPPALFRWSDRGGLADVIYELVERLGPPLNYSVDYRNVSSRPVYGSRDGREG